MFCNVYVASAALFVISVVLCFLPKLIIAKAATKKIYPLITMLTAGIQLATILLDLVPHMLLYEHHHHEEGVQHHFNGLTQSHSHSHSNDHLKTDSHNHSHDHSHITSPLMVAGGVFIILLCVDILFLHGNSCSHEHSENDQSHKHVHNHLHNHSHENIGTCNTSAIAKSSNRIQALIVLIAISLHSFFEGLSVSEKRITSTFAFGLLLHKILESFALGVAIFASLFGPLAKFFMVCFYSLLTPLGIIIASLLQSKDQTYAIWFNALSLGSLLFIVFI
ncbi:solute carrier family 39 (zinc transporter), member 1/2/3, partial [Pancytospora epiphaga]